MWRKLSYGCGDSVEVDVILYEKIGFPEHILVAFGSKKRKNGDYTKKLPLLNNKNQKNVVQQGQFFCMVPISTENHKKNAEKVFRVYKKII